MQVCDQLSLPCLRCSWPKTCLSCGGASYIALTPQLLADLAQHVSMDADELAEFAVALQTNSDASSSGAPESVANSTSPVPTIGELDDSGARYPHACADASHMLEYRSLLLRSHPYNWASTLTRLRLQVFMGNHKPARSPEANENGMTAQLLSVTSAPTQKP